MALIVNSIVDKRAQYTFRLKGIVVAVAMGMLSTSAIAERFPPAQNTLLNEIGKLESKRDAKCHATATRLEYLIYGTPLSDQARYDKAEYQKTFINDYWKKVAAEFPATDVLTLDAVKSVGLPGVSISFRKEEDDWEIKFKNKTVFVTDRDLKHYGSVAYSLRALLAIQQEQMLSVEKPLPSLSEDAIGYIKEKTDLVTLALIQIADQNARENDRYEISSDILLDSWKGLMPGLQNTAVATKQNSATEQNKATERTTGLMMGIIEQKLKAYEAYNQINNQLFSRNLQVYFAHSSLPEMQEEQKVFSQYLTEAITAFTGTLYLQAQAESANDVTINESAVQSAVDALLPHEVNSYEDVIFYPKFPAKRRIAIEAYDMDSFRDFGLHWRYLSYALSDLKDNVKKELDPFAAELLTEAVAHYGVLLLRTAGDLARIEQKKTETQLTAALITKAYQLVSQTVAEYGQYDQKAVANDVVTSADGEQDTKTIYFTEKNDDWHINMEHRSSDWLSRQMRSYLKKDEKTGITTIPPAFGGAGVAAEDINGDGLVDLLVLSGAGNKLYINTGSGFSDVTEKSGLNWQRPQDKLPGEPRQPLIADLDNDGDQDIVITYVNDEHRVYRNKGDGTFDDVTSLARLGGSGMVGGPATVVDVNNDGLLDIYIAYFGNYLKGDLPTLKRRNDNGTANQLFINQGNFNFVQAPNALGADNHGWGQAITHTDLNQDGWQDLIVGNDFGVNAYYINQKGKSFVDYAKTLGTDKPSYTMNISLSDLNGDGMPDVYISNIVTMNKDEKYVLPSEDTPMKFNADKLGNMRVIEGNDLFMSALDERRALNYTLSDKVGRGYSSTGWAWDADFFDVDNDGDEDLYVVNGMNDYYVYSSKKPYHGEEGDGSDVIFPDASRASNVFFINSNGRLHNHSAQSGLDVIANSRSAAYFDFEGDGDLDVVLNNYHDKVYVYQNNAEQLKNNWIQIKLIGDPAKQVNKDAIGAQVIVGYSEKGYAWRQVSGSQGYLSVHPKLQTIGVGKAKEARVVVIWPNGQREAFPVMSVNRKYDLTYGTGRFLN